MTETSNHKLFGRFGMQDDTINDPPQFPGQDPRRQRLFKNSGLALGYDSVLSERLTNSFRYGMTRIDEANQGKTNSNWVEFRFIDPFDGVGATFTNERQPTTHNFVNDLQWFKGAHSLKGGANIRFSRVPKARFDELLPERDRQPLVGERRRASATCPAARPVRRRCARSCRRCPRAGRAGYADSWINILGVITQSTQRANYNIDGTPQAPGSAVAREIASDEYEVYFQDSWQLRSNLTLTAGVRYGLFSPPYEVNGLQVAPAISMGEWFDQRVANMAQGIPSNRSPLVTFDLAGPANNRPGFYAWDKNNFAPRVSLAWSPTAEGGFLRTLDR